MKRSKDEDHFDIVDLTTCYMEMQNLEPGIASMLAIEIEMKIRVILQVLAPSYLLIGSKKDYASCKKESTMHRRHY